MTICFVRVVLQNRPSFVTNAEIESTVVRMKEQAISLSVKIAKTITTRIASVAVG